LAKDTGASISRLLNIDNHYLKKKKTATPFENSVVTGHGQKIAKITDMKQQK
jgi:hypothetical protein